MIGFLMVDITAHHIKALFEWNLADIDNTRVSDMFAR